MENILMRQPLEGLENSMIFFQFIFLQDFGQKEVPRFLNLYLIIAQVSVFAARAANKKRECNF